MIKQSVGIDIVQVNRFHKWINWPDQKLQRVFLVSEIAYAKSNVHFSAQRFAVRFAAKEAFLKAFQQLFPLKKVNLLTIMSAVSVAKQKSGKPYLVINYKKLFVSSLKADLSLSHTVCCAIAVVQLQSHSSKLYF